MAITLDHTALCPKPFLSAADYPAIGGELSARFCANVTSDLSCCLPCPMTQWVFSNRFDAQAPVANYVAIAAFVCNVLMLLTFAALPEEKGHRHYLSVGVTAALSLLALAFIIPLGTKPELCYNDITPNNMHTDMTCAWTGALLLLGAMGVVVWILLRSVWTALRIIWDFKRSDIFKWISLAFGIGLPIVFLAAELPVTGVSYRLYNVCIPNSDKAFETWFGWLLAFAILGEFFQIATILFCLWKYALNAFAGGPRTGHMTSNSSDTATSKTSETTTSLGRRPFMSARRRKRVEWRKLQKVLYLQWRSMLLAFVLVNETIYFGIVFGQQTGAAERIASGVLTTTDEAWSECLIESGGDKDACLALSSGLGLSEPRVIATLLLASLIGLVVFFLTLRASMITGWIELFSNPRRLLALMKGRRGSATSQDFIMQESPKHMSLQKPLESDVPLSPKPADHPPAPSTSMERPSEDKAWHEVELGHEKEKAVDEAEIVV